VASIQNDLALALALASTMGVLKHIPGLYWENTHSLSFAHAYAYTSSTESTDT